jgi:hypothetical protein
MVIGDKFVWGHLGKTGGNSVKLMFDVLVQLNLEKDDLSDPKKHNYFDSREKALQQSFKNKKKIMNIRRLPSWILSFAHHRERHDNYPLQKDKLLQGMVREIQADEEIIRWIKSAGGSIDHWLRTEYLTEDFIDVISSFASITEQQMQQIRSIHKTRAYYNKKVRDWFTNDELKKIYGCCPVWSSLEEELYVGLLIT